MTPQLRLVAVGAAGFAFSKFYLGKETASAITFGLAALAIVAILTIEKENTAIA